MSQNLQVLWPSNYKDGLCLENNQLAVSLLTNMWNLNNLGKFLCKYCLNYLMYFALYMIIWISLLWIHYLKMNSVNWTKYLSTCNYYDLFISKCTWFGHITNLWTHFPMKWWIWINLISYCVHIVSVF